jgi:hypothetical protein
MAAGKKLVISASGFLGSHDSFVASGADVRVMLRHSSSTAEIDDLEACGTLLMRSCMPRIFGV